MQEMQGGFGRRSVKKKERYLGGGACEHHSFVFGCRRTLSFQHTITQISSSAVLFFSVQEKIEVGDIRIAHSESRTNLGRN
jgi:hypothetical protein